MQSVIIIFTLSNGIHVLLSSKGKPWFNPKLWMIMLVPRKHSGVLFPHPPLDNMNHNSELNWMHACLVIHLWMFHPKYSSISFDFSDHSKYSHFIQLNHLCLYTSFSLLVIMTMRTDFRQLLFYTVWTFATYVQLYSIHNMRKRNVFLYLYKYQIYSLSTILLFKHNFKIIILNVVMQCQIQAIR